MRLVLDTSVLIGGIPRELESADLAVSSVSFAELAFGIAAETNARRRAGRQARLDRYRSALGPGLVFDDDAAAAFGQFCSIVISAGRSPRRRILDLMIAATAFANDAGVATRNAADFEDLRELLPIIAA